LALCVGTTVLIKMGKARYLWVTAVPMLFVGAITLTGSYELFYLFVGKGVSVGGPEQALSLYVDAALVGIVALLAVIVLMDSARQWYGYLVQGQPYTTSEVLVYSGEGSVAGSRPIVGDGINIPPGRCC